MRVRLDEIQQSDLSLFEFDYDLTMMVFFISPDEKIYGRYGGRDADGPDTRQSLAGLRFAMQSALDTHCENAATDDPPRKEPVFVRDFSASRQARGCIHCHQVKEIMHTDLREKGQWDRSHVFRYPLPENIGMTLDVDRGNLVKAVQANSIAAKAGVVAGDMIESIAGTQIRSFADAQFALDKSPAEGQVDVSWRRRGEWITRTLTLEKGWRRTDISWRPSMQELVAAPRLFGKDLVASERATLGLTETQMAFRQKKSVPGQARDAGIRPGDIVLGFDRSVMEMDAYDFQDYVRENYIVGDEVAVHLMRDGKRLDLPMKLR